MFCRLCGNEMPEDANFCQLCGTKQVSPEVVDSTPSGSTMTVPQSAEGRGTYKKQTGSFGQYGDVTIRVETYASKGYKFVNSVVDGRVPKKFVPAVEKGVKEALKEWAITDVKVTLLDGSYHDVDSNEKAFEIAASVAIKNALKEITENN